MKRYEPWKKHGEARKPLRTFKELAQEFGLKRAVLTGYLSHHNGPKPIFNTNNCSARNSWYDPDEMRKWWKELQEKLKAQQKPPSPPTRAFLAQQWLRENGPSTMAEIVDAGFINMSGLTAQRMVAHGALVREMRGGRVYYSATDVDYVTRRRKNEQG